MLINGLKVVEHSQPLLLGALPVRKRVNAVPQPAAGTDPQPPAPGQLLGFLLFLLVNATLFIRPAEIVPGLEDFRIYEALILVCLAVSLPAVLGQFNPQSLLTQPVTVCVFGLLLAIVLSHLFNFSIYGARTSGFEFAKVLVYYLLFVLLVNNPSRLRWFLTWLVGCTLVLVVLALLQYHGVINIPALKAPWTDFLPIEQTDLDEEADLTVFNRLCGAGIYNDPNDLCLILVTVMVICLYWLTNHGSRLLWRLPAVLLLGFFGYALALTQSRGGFIALLIALLVLFSFRYSGWKSFLLVLVILPIMFQIFDGRMTSISTSEETAQGRIQLWSEGIALFREAPMFGIGQGEYTDQVGQPAHNSFVHCYAELGFFGGTFFLGAFVCALWSLYRLGRARVPTADPQLARLRPYLITIVAAYAAGLLSLSRAYIVPTYMVLGLASAYVRLASPYLPAAALRFDGQLVGRLLVASAASVVGIYIFVRIFVQYA